MTDVGVSTFFSFFEAFSFVFMAALLIVMLIMSKTTAARQKFGILLLAVLALTVQQWLSIIGTFLLVRFVLIVISFCLMVLLLYRSRKDKPFV